MHTRFADALIARKKAGFIPVIPDIKCTSPKEGDLLRGRDPLAVAQLLARAGAPALSVVTEPKDFGGSLDLLRQLVKATTLPILRKDFITSREDLRVTRDCGARAVLLICALYTLDALTTLHNQALDIGLEPLVEAHTAEELGWAGTIGARLVGINNRNILELERDDGTVSATELLARHKPENAILISESSIQTPAEGQAAIRAGADVLLIGTAIWQADDMAAAYQAFSRCGGNPPA